MISDGTAVMQDRSVFMDKLECRVRFIPSFHRRFVEYESNAVEDDCAFCDLRRHTGSSASDLRGVPSRVTELPGRLRALRNDFPYLRDQFTIIFEHHAERIDRGMLRSMLEFVRRSHFRSAAMQVRGSGATIPGHAHFSVSTETIPISHLPVTPMLTTRDTAIGVSRGLPHLVLVLDGSIVDEVSVAMDIIDILTRIGLSFNLYADDNARVFIAPRRAENSPTRSTSMFVQSVLGPTDRPTERQEARPAEAVRASDLLFHCRDDRI